MSLHGVLLVLHSLVRWLVIGFAGAVFVRTLFLRRGREWTATDGAVLRGFVGLFDLQVSLGLLMYFGTSALGVRMLAYGKLAMKEPTLRFFAVEHITGMLVAAAVLHVGTVRAKRLGETPARQIRTAIVVGITLAIVVASIPWPVFPYARPLFRIAF